MSQRLILEAYYLTLTLLVFSPYVNPRLIDIVDKTEDTIIQ